MERGGVDGTYAVELDVALLVVGLRVLHRRGGPCGKHALRLECVELLQVALGEWNDVAAHLDVAAIGVAHVAVDGAADHAADELERDDGEHADSDAEDRQEGALAVARQRACGIGPVDAEFHGWLPGYRLAAVSCRPTLASARRRGL